MRKTQIADSAFAAFWQGLVLQCVLLALVVLFFGAADLLRIYCAAMAAQLLTTGYLLWRRPTEPTVPDRLMIRFGIVPLAAVAYLAASPIASLLQ